ncbi:MAG: autotransporter-associated beta strand repeat-containing protein [Verrucomicrobiota bacterium]
MFMLRNTLTCSALVLCGPILLHAQTILVDTLTVNDTISGPTTPTSINFASYGATFSEVPLIFALPTDEGSNSAAFRINNVTTSGFDITVAEVDSFDGPHIAMTNVSFIAVTPGRHEIQSGVFLDASRRTIDNATASGVVIAGGGTTQSVTFREDYSAAPAVLAQIQTTNNETRSVPAQTSQPWLTSQIQNITTSGFDLSLERSESGAGSITTTEQVGILALQNINGGSFLDDNGNTISWEAFISGTVIDGWDDSGATVSFNNSYSSTPLALASKASRIGGDGGWIRRSTLDTSGITLLIDEDTANDSERNHTNEQASITAFSGNVLESVSNTDGSSRIIWQGPGATDWDHIDSWDRWDGDDYNLIDGEDTLVFNNAGAGDTTASVDTAYTNSLRELIFEASTAYTLDATGGGGLIITDGGSITNDSSSTQTLGVPISGRGSTLNLDTGTTSGGSLVFNSAGTLNLSDSGGVDLNISGSNSVIINSVISGSGGSVTQSGTGTTTLTGNNTFTGPLVINSGTLLLGADNIITDSVATTLGGGTLDTGGNSDTLGTLTLSSNSTIDLNSGNSILQFADSSGIGWTSGTTLLISNWSGALETGGGTDQVFFGNSVSGLTTGQIGQIQFLDPVGLAPGLYGARILTTGEVIPLPEAESAVALVILLLLSLNRRFTARSVAS